MELYFVCGGGGILVSSAANPDLKLNAEEETERRGNICGKLRAKKRKNLYKKKKKQGHIVEDTENKNTYRTPFCQVISKKEEDL